MGGAVARPFSADVWRWRCEVEWTRVLWCKDDVDALVVYEQWFCWSFLGGCFAKLDLRFGVLRSFFFFGESIVGVACRCTFHGESCFGSCILLWSTSGAMVAASKMVLPLQVHVATSLCWFAFSAGTRGARRSAALQWRFWFVLATRGGDEAADPVATVCSAVVRRWWSDDMANGMEMGARVWEVKMRWLCNVLLAHMFSGGYMTCSNIWTNLKIEIVIWKYLSASSLWVEKDV